jgi:fagellar hook-basal body proteins
MMRALYSGVSGLQAHQVKMDVLSNDIANVNTIGYKKSTVTFQDLLSQTIAGAQAGTASSAGGVNAQQIGTGVQVGAITMVTTQGAASTTGSDTDLMIEGDGYFILKDSNDNTFYTRAGAFSLDSAGNLVNSANGALVCDSDEQAINIGEGSSNISIASDGTITYTDSSGDTQTYGSKLGLATFVNPSGLTKAGDNTYTESVASGTATVTTPGTNAGTITSGALEMSNVDLAQSFVDMIIAQRGYQANSKTIKTADEMLQVLINLKS